ncbi:hypothetical protein ACHAW6_002609 [Cyclotella cf. meneghiniana]
MQTDQQRCNAVERAIQTFKGHFISKLAGVADNFPIHQWDELLPQTILTLNLLWQIKCGTKHFSICISSQQF